MTLPAPARGLAGQVRLGEPVTVRVRASSANLGPGFDSMGLALAVHDVVTVEASEPAADGHPDNADAAVFGGLVLSWVDDAPARAHLPPARSVRLTVDRRVRLVVCVPDSELPSAAARAMLPGYVPHADAAFTAGRAALL